MPIIVKARKGDDNTNLIKKFKKFLMIDDVVTEVRDRRYHKKPALLRNEANKKRLHSIKLSKLPKRALPPRPAAR